MMILDLMLAVYRKIDPGRRLLPWNINKYFEINGIKITGDRLDPGFMVYYKHYNEAISRFYELVAKDYKPGIILDIGANYGFISLICHKYMPESIMIAIEPNKRVYKYLIRNFDSIHNCKLLNNTCGEIRMAKSSFFLNPRGSQDGRVLGKKGWKYQPVPMTTIDTELDGVISTVFIKTDTQGYEEYVYKGGRRFFNSNKNWLMRMEFCPILFEHHFSNPQEFLLNLVLDYDVTDIGYVPYNTKSIDVLFKSKLTREKVNGFITYVRNLKENGTGWIDLLIRPKK